ncbi:MAG: phytanoyl-CoA dioxygenase family protein [Flavobacteriales bacterium]|nr:phytanoyl-CoA dioxygenase family protein [Flavobacteriales bacterium]
MKAVFKDSQLQKQIESQGYVIVPLLSEEEVARLASVYNKYGANENSHEFYLSIWLEDEQLKSQVHDEIVNVIKDRCGQVLNDYKHLVSNFAVKYPGENSEFDLHQGINFVDESEFVSVTVWIPLQDVSEKNGCMRVVPGSHRFFEQSVRSQHYLSPFENIKDEIKSKYSVSLEMKAGHAWIFDHRLLHYSPVNQSQEVRLATLNIMTPSEAPVILYYKASNDHLSDSVEILEFLEDNYHLQNVHAKPNLPGIVSRGYAKELHYEVSLEQFDQCVKSVASLISD